MTPTIVPRDELVQVNLNLSLADTVPGGDQPRLEVPMACRPGARPTCPPAGFRAQRLDARDMFETLGRRELFEATGVARRARE